MAHFIDRKANFACVSVVEIIQILKLPTCKLTSAVTANAPQPSMCDIDMMQVIIW